MYIYSVTITIEKEAEQEWVAFMQEKHIAEVLETGYFTGASMRKDMLNNDKLYAVYNIEYAVATEEDYYTYQQQAAPALQKDVSDRFAGKFTAQRKFYTVLFEQ